MKEKELKRLEALEHKMDSVLRWIESHQAEGKRIGEYARGGVRMRPGVPNEVVDLHMRPGVPNEVVGLHTGPGVPNEELKLILKEQGIHIHKTGEPLDLTKILEVGDVVTTDAWGDIIIKSTKDKWVRNQPISGDDKSSRRTWTREGFWDVHKKEVERLKPKNGKTWSQFIVEKEEKKQQIPTLEKAIEDIKKGLEKFDAPEVEVHMTLKKLKSGGYAPSKIHVTDH